MDKKQGEKKKNQTVSDAVPKKENQLQKGTDFIHSVVHEYLLKKEYYKTLDSFQV